MVELSPLVTQQDRITDRVYEQLKTAIFDGTLRPGDRLSVPKLAAQLQVSRSPVREAVVRLAKERLAVDEPRRGAVVAQIDLNALIDLYQVREVLEGLVARMAAVNATPAVILELERLHKGNVAAVSKNKIAEHFRLDMEFHRVCRVTAANAEAVRLLDEIQTQIELAGMTTLVSGTPDKSLADHERILAAIKSQDPNQAEAQARKHIARLRSLMESVRDA